MFSNSTLAGLQQIASKFGVTVDELAVSGDVRGGLIRRLNQLGIIYVNVDRFPANWLRRVDAKIGKSPLECLTGSKEDLDALCAEVRK